MKRATGFSKKKKYIDVSGLDLSRGRSDEEIDRLMATSQKAESKQSMKPGHPEKYDLDTIQAEARYSKELTDLKSELGTILRDSDRYKLFLEEYGATGYDIYRELLEYQFAIRDAMGKDNYSDMKNLKDQWDPNSVILRKIRGEWAEPIRQFGELTFQPRNDFEGFLDQEEAVQDKIARQIYFQEHPLDPQEEPRESEPVRLFAEYLRNKQGNVE